MIDIFAARFPGRPAGMGAALAALAGETRAAFEALARRRYDAPWQRVAPPRGIRR